MSKPDDKPATKEELAAAQALGERVDSLLDQEAAVSLPTAPLLESEERELTDLSLIIHSAHHDHDLHSASQATIIEAALAQGAGVASQDELANARARRTTRWPIAAVGVIAIAALAFLMLRPEGGGQHNDPIAQVMQLPQSQHSRSSDRLVGQIHRGASADAGQRLDLIYGDRMSGYRALQYRRLVGEQ